MGKRKKKKSSPSLARKAVKGSIHLMGLGLIKSSPFLILATIGFGIFWGIRENLYADPGFLVQTVKILPENSLSRERLLQLQGMYLDKNLFKISPRQVAEEVEKDPKIREARVVREFPKTLRIEVRDRNPFAQVQFFSKGEWFSVAQDGVILGRDGDRNKNLLLIEAFEAGSLTPDIGTDIAQPGFKQAVATVRAFGRHPLSHSEIIDRVRLDHLGNVNLVLLKGPELRLGREPLKRFTALNSLNPLLKGPERDRILYIDLQYQDLIVRKK